MDKVKCENCQGDGWHIDHSDRHYHTGDDESCEQAGCPVQRQCETCQATGYIELPFTDTSAIESEADSARFHGHQEGTAV